MRDKTIFVDTNILLYAHDKQAGEKTEKARNLVAGFWDRKKLPWISVQVLQELYTNLHRKGIPSAESRHVVENYLQWNVVENDLPLLRDGMLLQERYKVSIWDALVVAAAVRVGAEVLYSEDFNSGQEYDGVKAVNPL
jgi:predicted nucleic acid-binding protein